ncbi:MAG: FtsX-like permease family protein [Chloroflexota bacterium]|jgi:hypothetical protein|nr:FtsX-like permease family protein [Chloroflexota bacterium]
MPSTLIATLLVSLRRTRAAWPIALAAGLTCMLASTLLAAGPIYASAVSVAGLQRVLSDSPVDAANIEVSLRTEADQADSVDGVVSSELEQVLAGIGGPLARFGRSDSFDLPTALPGPIPDLVELGFAEGLSEHATLLDGAWPRDEDRGSGSTEPVPVAVGEHVAMPLGLAVGDVLQLDSRIHQAFSVPVRIAGVFRIDDPADAYWWGESQVLDGLVTSQDFATHGPFFTTRDQLLARTTVGRLRLIWRAFPDPGNVTIDDIAGLEERIGQLDGRIEASTSGIPVTVSTTLPEILARAERSLLVSRTGVLLLTVQLAVLAAYAVLLSAALLVEHRRVDTAMLRSRGAGPVRIAGLTLVEAVLLTVPAAVIAPWVAVIALTAFNVVGPLAAIELPIEPVVSPEAYLAAAAGAAGCLIALVLPALPTRRSFAAVQRGVSRASTTPTSQRIGLDLALLAVAGLGLWQLRLYGAPLTRTVQGAVGIDPLLVAAPAIGLLAGAVVALRLLPLVAGLVERATSRGRGLVSALGARQLARRPLRYTRAALLLMLAMSMGVFAVSYGWTWSASQHDQAGYQVGADLRVEPGLRSAALPRWALDSAYGSVPGVVVHMPVDRAPVAASRSESGEIVALDAATAPSIVVFRPDLADAALPDLLAPLADARPGPELVRLAGKPSRLRVDVSTALDEVGEIEFDPVADAFVDTPADPTRISAWRGLRASVVVRDASGMLYRFAGEADMIGGGRHELVVGLGDPGDTSAALAYPLDLLAIELAISLPPNHQVSEGAIVVLGLQAAPGDDPWQPVPLDLGDGWRLSSSVYGQPHDLVEPVLPAGGLTATVGRRGLSSLVGVDAYGRATVLTFAPAVLTAIGEATIPVVASTPFLDASARSVGDELMIDLEGRRHMIEVVGEVLAFPTVEADEPVLVMDFPTLALVRFEGTDSVDPANEWWLDLGPGESASVSARLEAAPFQSRSVVSLEGREQALATDPVALGIIGALSIGFVAAALFAVVGFVVSAAVSARERVSEFALLRALGLSPGQLSGWLSLENVVLAAVSLVAGTALGLLIAWVVLPFVTVTQEARIPYPPVILEVPWATIVVLEVVSIIALGATVIVLAWLLRRIGLAAVLRTGED